MSDEFDETGFPTGPKRPIEEVAKQYGAKVQTGTAQDFLDGLRKDIEGNEYAVITLQDSDPPTTLTIGLAKLSLPELAIMGLDPPTAHGLLSAIANHVIKHKLRLVAGELLPEEINSDDFDVHVEDIRTAFQKITAQAVARNELNGYLLPPPPAVTDQDLDAFSSLGTKAMMAIHAAVFPELVDQFSLQVLVWSDSKGRHPWIDPDTRPETFAAQNLVHLIHTRITHIQAVIEARQAMDVAGVPRKELNETPFTWAMQSDYIPGANPDHTW